MNSAVISRVNKIRLPELQPYLFKFYHFKKTVGYKYNNIKVVEEAPGIKVTDKDTKEIYDNDAYNRKHENTQDDYNTACEDLDEETDQNDQKYGQKYHGDHDSYEHNNTYANINPQQGDNYDAPQKHGMDHI